MNILLLKNNQRERKFFLNMKRVVYLLFAGIAAFVWFGYAASHRPASFELEWENERLSVSAQKAALADILLEIKRQTGHRVDHEVTARDTVSISFKGLPLAEGIRRLLAAGHPAERAVATTPNTSRPGAAPANPHAKLATRPATGIVGEINLDSGALQDAALHHPNSNARLASLQKLIGIRDPALTEVVLAATKDADPTIRQLAYHQLYRLDKAQAVEALSQDSASADVDIRQLAVESSAQLMGDEAADLLAHATEDGNPSIKQMAFDQLARLGDRGLEAIRAKLSHADPEIRLMALTAMAAKGEGYAAEAAGQALYDDDELVRDKAKGLLQDLEAAKYRSAALVRD
jgi:HEAT repeats